MFIYNFIISKNKLTANNHFGILFISLLFGVFFPILLQTKILLSLFFLALAFRRVYSLSTYNDLKEKLFDSGLLIGLASIMFQENAIFIFLIYFAIFAFRYLKLKFILIPVIGFITPYILIYIYSLVSDNWLFFEEITKPTLFFNSAILKNPLIFYYTSIIGLISLFSYVLFTIKSNIFSNKFRTIWILVFGHFMLSLLILFLGNKDDNYNSTPLILPAGVILANYTKVISKKWLKEVFVILIICLSLSRLIYSLLP